MTYETVNDLVANWTGSVMNGLGYSPYRSSTKDSGGIQVPKFSEVKFHFLDEKTVTALAIGYFVVRMKDPDCKVYVGDSYGQIWETLLLKEDLPALRIELEELGLEQQDSYGIWSVHLKSIVDVGSSPVSTIFFLKLK